MLKIQFRSPLQHCNIFFAFEIEMKIANKVHLIMQIAHDSYYVITAILKVTDK